MSRHISMRSCVSIIVYASRLSDTEMASLRQIHYVFGSRHDIVLVKGSGVDDISAFTSTLGNCIVREVDQSKVSSVYAYNDFALTPEFYDVFSDYDYVLILQLDGWVFYDALDWWASRGYDYVGGPWFFGGRYAFNHTQGRRVGGNGGMSLRRVVACREFADAVSRVPGVTRNAWEDRVFSRGSLRRLYDDVPYLCYPDYCDQARFCWNNPGKGLDGNPYVVLRSMTGSELPMCLHKPYGAIYRRLCIPDEDPDSVFVLGNSFNDSGVLVSRLSECRDSGKRALVVLFNECRPLLREDSNLLDTLLSEARFLTIHTETSDNWIGPYCHFSSVGSFLGPAEHDYQGRHDVICLGAEDGRVTYDGEIPALVWEEAYRKTGVCKTDDTDNAQFVVSLLGARYPGAQIVQLL